MIFIRSLLHHNIMHDHTYNYRDTNVGSKFEFTAAMLNNNLVPGALRVNTSMLVKINRQKRRERTVVGIRLEK